MKRIFLLGATLVLLGGCWWADPGANTGPSSTSGACSLPDWQLDDGGTYSFSHCTIAGQVQVFNGTHATFSHVQWSTSGSDTYALSLLGTGVASVDHCEMTGTYHDAAIYSEPTTGSLLVSACELHGLPADGVKISGTGNTTVQNTWIHDIGTGSGEHGDGVQTQYGLVNTELNGNVIVGGTNAAIMINPAFGSGGNSSDPVEVNLNKLSCDGCNFPLRFLLVASEGPYYQDGVQAEGNYIFRGNAACVGGGNACDGWISYGTAPWIYTDGIDVFDQNMKAETCDEDPNDPGAYDPDTCEEIPAP